jgi:lysozyme family protein
MANFLQAVSRLLKIEGGYAKRDNNAGAVNFGITERFLKAIGYPKRDPKLLTQVEAIQIYQLNFWEPYLCGSINDQRIAQEYFFAIVNAGPYRMTQDLQMAAHRCGQPIAVDGRMGPATIQAVNAVPADKMLAAFKVELEARYKKIASVGPEYADDLASWQKRIEEAEAA